MRASNSVLLTFFLLVSMATALPRRQPQPHKPRSPAESAVGHLRRPKEPVPIISMTSELNPDGSYHYSFETADGTKAEQVGEIKDLGEGEEGSVSYGAYEFIADDGRTYKVTYTADENGFQPKGAHLPVPPPVPEAIARAIAFATSRAEAGEYPRGAEGTGDEDYGASETSDKL